MFYLNIKNESIKNIDFIGNFYLKLFKNSRLLILSLLKKKKYNLISFINKDTNIYIKNTLVNTYLSMTVGKKVVFAKSAGSVGFKKKQRRVKAAAYKLGKELSIVLNRCISNNQIRSLYINLVGYSRYYRAIVSNLRKSIKSGLKLKRVTDNTLLWKSKLKSWRFKKKIIQYFFKKPFRVNKQQLEYEKFLETQVKKNASMVLFLKKIFDRTSVPHGGIKCSKYIFNNRYW